MACRQVDPDRSAVLLNSTSARPKQETDIVLDRSRGGFRTPIPRWADRQGRRRPLRVTGEPGLGRWRFGAPGGRGRTWRPARARRLNSQTWHRASVGSHAGGARPPAMTHTRIVAWFFYAWRRLGSDESKLQHNPDLASRRPERVSTGSWNALTWTLFWIKRTIRLGSCQGGNRVENRRQGLL